jgi:hypothetical protein
LRNVVEPELGRRDMLPRQRSKPGKVLTRLGHAFNWQGTLSKPRLDIARFLAD